MHPPEAHCLLDPNKRLEFERLVLPHLDAAHNLARWLVRHPHDAQELAQDAIARAVRFFGNFRGGNARAWLLTIVRHTCFEWLKTNRRRLPPGEFDEQTHGTDGNSISSANITMSLNPEAVLLGKVDGLLLQEELSALPVQFREVLVLREMEDCSYQAIAEITDVPIGTVMSRLSRARRLLHERLALRMPEGYRS